MSSLQTFSFLPPFSVSPSLLFVMLIFPCLLLCPFQSPRIRLFFVLSGKKCCCNYFSSSSIIFVIFLSPSFYVMEQHQSSASNILYSLFCMPNSCYINIPGYVALTGSINILFKCFPCILSISFISSFPIHPYDSILY